MLGIPGVLEHYVVILQKVNLYNSCYLSQNIDEVNYLSFTAVGIRPAIQNVSNNVGCPWSLIASQTEKLPLPTFNSHYGADR